MSIFKIQNFLRTASNDKTKLPFIYVAIAIRYHFNLYKIDGNYLAK